MEIISGEHEEYCVEYTRRFDWADDPMRGFSFPADPDGRIRFEDMRPEGVENLTRCLSGQYDVIDRGLDKYEWLVRHRAVGRCQCGERVELGHFTNTCDCGRDYNMSGQLLAPRSQWGEETGEHWSECI